MPARCLLRRASMAGVVLVVLAALNVSVAGATATLKVRDATMIAHASQTAQAQAACEADGATVATAMAAFRSQNPRHLPSMAVLMSKRFEGPYLQSAPDNPAYYQFSINSRGELLLATVRTLGPPIVYATPVAYEGPQACSRVVASPRSVALNDAMASCVADTSIVKVAIDAFEFQNKGKFPTMADLTGKRDGGPYLTRAPHDPDYYRISIGARGAIILATVQSLGPPIEYHATLPFAGSKACGTIWSR